ncbi:MAG: N-6 DNA methylase [Gammaproteobacteria bacterium]
MTAKYKGYGVVYTPEWIVDLILDKTMRNYDAARSVCGPACGDGAFLVRLVERVCDALPAKDCRMALGNIAGFDIDAGALVCLRPRIRPDHDLWRQVAHFRRHGFFIISSLWHFPPISCILCPPNKPLCPQ